MGRNITNDLLFVLQQWAWEGQVIRDHMVSDAVHSMVGFEDVVCMVRELHLVYNAIGLVSNIKSNWDSGTWQHGHSWSSATNRWDISHTA